VNDLLLITDMARLRKFFERLADDNRFTLRVVNNLEKGGEEIAIKKPDIVFVQTHLSGLSSDILLMHLKKQLGRKRTRFVLLAPPGQVNSDILKSYQGWLDISCKERELTQSFEALLSSFLSKGAKPDPHIRGEEMQPPETVTEEPMVAAVTPALLIHNFDNIPDAVVPLPADVSPPLPSAVTIENSLEDIGITYSPRPRLSVYSEFNSSFDNAVNRIEEPEALKEYAPVVGHSWNTSLIDRIETVPPRSKHSTFLLWLAPVVVVVVIVTFFQMKGSVTNPVEVIATQSASSPLPVKTAETPAPLSVKTARVPAPVTAEQAEPPVSVKPAPDSAAIDRAVIKAIAEIYESKATSTPTPTKVMGRLSTLPDFIPRYGLDKHYGKANPGWERYKGNVTEFKIFREGEMIKAIQVVDRGGKGVPESFMKGVMRQVAKKPILSVEASEKKDGYIIERGKVSENLNVVYYRDEQGGRLRAFVMTWL